MGGLKGLYSEDLWMADLVVDLFAEDRAHEAFVGALVRRLLREADQRATLHVRSVLGGHGRALAELRAFQKAIQGRQPGLEASDILVIARDANCSSFAKARQGIVRCVDPNVFPVVAIACPDPHIERWFLADPVTFST